MAAIGITGSIASGKSAFRDLLVQILPAQAADADAIARRLLDEDAEVREEVSASISPDAFRSDGSPDRDMIRRVIYGDAAAKARLEAILHPRVRRAWMEEAAAAKKAARHFVADIPLLFETGAEGHFDFTVTVACSPDVQHARLAARGMEPGLAKKIIATQMPVPDKIARSSHVVWNDGSLSALYDQAESFAARLRGELH